MSDDEPAVKPARPFVTFSREVNLGHLLILGGGLLSIVVFYGTVSGLSATSNLRLQIVEDRIATLTKDEQAIALLQAQVAAQDQILVSVRATENLLLAQIGVVREDVAVIKSQLDSVRQQLRDQAQR